MATLPDVIAISSTTRIADWTASHGLTPDEVARLESVLIDYPPDEVAGELDEELRCIFGARKLARMPKLTREDFSASCGRIRPYAVQTPRCRLTSIRLAEPFQDVEEKYAN